MWNLLFAVIFGFVVGLEGAGVGKKASGYGDVPVKCDLCVIAVNEVVGLFNENRTEEEVAEILRKDVCPLLPSVFGSECEALSRSIPEVARELARVVTPTGVCVGLGLCPRPVVPPNGTDMSLPVFNISLDVPAGERFRGVCSHGPFVDAVRWLVGRVRGVFSEAVYEALVAFGELVETRYLPGDMAAEVAGCGAAMGLPRGVLGLVAMVYELSDFCTSVVVDQPGGPPVHARNLDFGIGGGFTATIRELLYEARVVRGGRVVYRGVYFAGYFGVLTGVRPGAFGLSIDTRWRRSLLRLPESIVRWLEGGGGGLVASVTRELFEGGRVGVYGDAVEYLAGVRLTAPVYFIVSGVRAGEGVVLARDAVGVAHRWGMDGGWYTGVTNYDRGPQPWWDDRWDPFVRHMEALGRGRVSVDAMYGVMSMKPTLNLETTYTAIMVPASGYLRVEKRYCEYPCVE